jgi:putative membrane protein
MKEQRFSLASDLIQLLRGFLMGGADVVPGVSGGTVALIVGIYERLVTAVSHFDITSLNLVRQRRWREVAQRVDLRFLVALGCGILSGIIVLGEVIQRLLSAEPSRSLTWASFLGMILGSAVIVARRVVQTAAGHVWTVWMAGLIGGIFAFWLTGLPMRVAEPTPLYIFFCGAIGICAMILPGISGAYLLLVLGLYPHLTDILHHLAHGEVYRADLVTMAIFGSGCAVGLILFSKVLKWLLARHATNTMAVLCGFIIGALRRVWPFQHDLTPNEELKHKVFEAYLPRQLDGHVVACIAVMLVAFLAIVAIDRLGNRVAADISPAT